MLSVFDGWQQSQYCDIALKGNQMCWVFFTDINLPENHLAAKDIADFSVGQLVG